MTNPTVSPVRRPLPTAHRPLPTAHYPLTLRRLLPAAFCLLLLLTGCNGTEKAGSDGAAERPLAGIELRLVVAGDPELAAAIEQLRGEWSAQTGGELRLEQTTEAKLDEAKSLPGDAVLLPAHQLGALAERGLVAPLPKALLHAQQSEWSGIFELLRSRETSWGTEAMAVPFGSPLLTCYYRADLLKELGRKPPQTWAQYQDLAQLLSDRKNLGDAAPPDDAPWSGTAEPLGPGWAGLVLLARAAPYATHRSNYSTLFNIQTMEPLIAGPPMVRALEELMAAAKLGSSDQLKHDPAAVRAAFWQGRCGMALTWPTAAKNEAHAGDQRSAPAKQVANAQAGGRPPQNIQVGFATLPGSGEVFDISSRGWTKRTTDDDPHVPLLGVAGRVGAISAKSGHAAAAMQLLFWLSGDQTSPQVCPASPATTIFRRSQLNSPRLWVEPEVPPVVAAQYAALTEQSMRGSESLYALRIPGRAEYLAALDAAVQSAVRGEQSPIEALHKAATRWQEITARLGVEQQQAAYRRSLGLK